MIGHLSGTALLVSHQHLLLDVSGVGYRVYAAPNTLLPLVEGDTVSLFIHTAVRENALDLYGFSTHTELSFFELLITISGIGPKSALGILSVAPIDTLKKAISAGDPTYLTQVSGIGKKSAERIVVELRDKLSAGLTSSDMSGMMKEETDALAALQSLGYTTAEARDALKDVPADITGTDMRIKEALRRLGSA
jgi:Holliday junction DNA helicase RuvA